MTVWVDQPIWPGHGTVYSHLISDVDLDELHAIAGAAGLDPRSFDGDHYDVSRERLPAVIGAGATPTTGADLVRRLNASGLRIRKRKGDRALSRVLGHRFISGDIVDVDLIVSARPAPERSVGMSMCVVRDAQARFALVWSPRRLEWGAPGGWREPGESPAQGAAREVFEESGLRVRPENLEAVGYERFTAVTPQQRGDARRPILQVFAVTLAGSSPPLVAEFADQPAPRWAHFDEVEAMCAGLFWWPLFERVAMTGHPGG